MSIWAMQQARKTEDERKSASDGQKAVDFAERIIIAASRKISTEWDLDSLRSLARLRQSVDSAERDVVARLREEGEYSWTDIGDALGITRQAAQQRFGNTATCRQVDSET